MLPILVNDHIFNKLAHYLFPARTFLKELIYWPCEIAAAILMFIYILQVETTPQLLYYSKDNMLMGRRYTLATGNRGGSYASATATVRGTAIPFGIMNLDNDPMNAGKVFRIEDYETDLLNREYAWICLCYIIKHTFYLAETLFMLQYKKFKVPPHGRPIDVATPLLNVSLWIFWGVYGWLNSGDQIFGGMYERFQKDVVLLQGVYTDEQLAKRNESIDMLSEAYKNSLGWNWLWIPTFIIFFFHLVLFILNLQLKRSSAYHGQALSTLVIPVQLLFLNLFIKGVWIKSNAVNLSISPALSSSSVLKTFSSFYNAYEFLWADYFDARWVFWLIFLASFAGVVFAIICFVKGFHDMPWSRPVGIKYIAYSVFWVSAFVWVMCMDGTLYNYYYQAGVALVSSHVVCIVAAVVVAIASIWEKSEEGQYYFERHNFWYVWETDHFAINYPHWSQRMVLEQANKLYEAPIEAPPEEPAHKEIPKTSTVHPA